MSIMEHDEEIVTLGTVNGWAFRIAIWFAPIFAIWMTAKVLAHDTDIAVLKMQFSMRGDNSKMSQSVNVGQNKDATLAKGAKTWLTTKDVAERQGITERTVLNYIESGMIDPAPVKNGKAWEIAENFRILPNHSDDCCKFPNQPKP
jgi:hypothetical protein